MKPIIKHFRDFLIPIVVTIFLPLWINEMEHRRFQRPRLAQSTIQFTLGLMVCLVGLVLMISSIVVMICIAKSTIMPWDPSQNLVVAGPYRHLRNPMILGVILLLVGEALVLSSYGIAILAIAFFILNTGYFILFEEPRLEAQFGEAYRQYKANVPRWLPRIKAWRSEEIPHENRSS